MAKRKNTPAPEETDLGALLEGAGELLGAGPDLDDLLAEPVELETAPDPFADIDYTGDLSVDSALELTALEQAYRDRAKREDDRFRDATDTEHWVAFCFVTRADKEAWLARTGLADLGDKFIDGIKAAKILDRR